MTTRKPTHPGEVLREDVIKPLGLTVTQAARDLGVSRKTLSELIHQRASLSPEMALGIAKATSTSPENRPIQFERFHDWIPPSFAHRYSPLVSLKEYRVPGRPGWFFPMRAWW